MFDFNKMWKKSGKDLVKTVIAGAGAGGGLSVASGGNPLETAALSLGTAVLSAAITAISNWWKHR